MKKYPKASNHSTRIILIVEGIHEKRFIKNPILNRLANLRQEHFHSIHKHFVHVLLLTDLIKQLGQGLDSFEFTLNPLGIPKGEETFKVAKSDGWIYDRWNQSSPASRENE